MIDILNGKTVEEVVIGEKASMSKTIGETDVYMFTALTGSLNPLYQNEVYASKTEYGRRIVPELLLASMLPATQGNFLPGEGNVHLKQKLEFHKPAFIGDTVTTEVEIINKDVVKNRVTIRNTCRNQNGEVLVTGEAVVWPKKNE
ncbi:MAG TPA: enoyl-CoA hydratase [Firmicutes bacterium]|mgnify:CR=1 FL=1|jgi:3-hydroxybutyryl-CoA dehydratase|nr:enoyl-CoA hydratase [Bacillota bacterium]HBK69797.1 enoyl-CoA hydratase [Bacillota bacterium]